VLERLLERLPVQLPPDEHHLALALLTGQPLAVRSALEDGVDTLQRFERMGDEQVVGPQMCTLQYGAGAWAGSKPWVYTPDCCTGFAQVQPPDD
jgi:hypothetical protein